MKEFLKRLLLPKPPRKKMPVKPGLYHCMWTRDGIFHRFHLRTEPDGSGMLLVNASAVLRLNPTGVIMARGILDREEEEKTAARVDSCFTGVSRDEALEEVKNMKRLIDDMMAPDTSTPLMNLDDPSFHPREASLMAPFRADVPLERPEKLKPILERLWEIGIPVVTLKLPHEPDPGWAVELVEHAGDLGMITGVCGRAMDLGGEGFLEDLALAGLDYATFFYASPDHECHDALFGSGDHQSALDIAGAIRKQEVCPVACMPLLETNIDFLENSARFLRKVGVNNILFFAVAALDDAGGEETEEALRASALPQAAAMVEEIGEELEIGFVWLPPVKRSPMMSLREQVTAGPRCMGDVAIRVEPNGSVIPPRGPYRSAGNLFEDSWEKIWGNEAFRNYRERVEAPTRCETCPGLAICAADCPREPAGWASPEKGREE